MIPLRTQLSEALTLLAVPFLVIALGFWLRFDAPIWSAF